MNGVLETIIGLLLGVIAWLLRQQLAPPLIGWLRETNQKLSVALLFAAGVIFTGMAVGKLRDVIAELRISHTSQYWLVRAADRLKVFALVARALLIPYMWVWAYWNYRFYEPTFAIWVDSTSLVIASFFLMPELPDQVVHLLTKPRRRVPMRRLIARLRTAASNLLNAASSKQAAALPEETTNSPAGVTRALLMTPLTERKWLVRKGDDPIGEAIVAFLKDEDATQPLANDRNEEPELESNADERRAAILKQAGHILGINLLGLTEDPLGHRTLRGQAVARLNNIRADIWTRANNCRTLIESLTEEQRSNIRSAKGVQAYEDLNVNTHLAETRQTESIPAIYDSVWATVLLSQQYWDAARGVAFTWGAGAVFPGNPSEREIEIIKFLYLLSRCPNGKEAAILILKDMPPFFPEPVAPSQHGVDEYEKMRAEKQRRPSRPHLTVEPRNAAKEAGAD